MSSKKQTVSYLRRKFAEVGLRPQAKHGQNFLIDLNILDLIVREADIQPSDVVLEIGMGTGSLSVRLAEHAAHVVSVEIDPYLAEIAREQFAPDAPITVLQQDALRNKNQLHPSILDTVAELLQVVPHSRFQLVANLPYGIATPVISNLLAGHMPPTAMTVTIQKELAERIVAHPRSKDYSSLSVWVQSQCRATILRELAPTVFWPRPQVKSAIVQIVLDPTKRAALGDLQPFHYFVRHLFLHRRKRLRGALVAAFSQVDKSAADRVMAALNLAIDDRAEELTVEQIIELYRSMQRILGPVAPDGSNTKID